MARKWNQGISDLEPVIFLFELHASLPYIFLLCVEASGFINLYIQDWRPAIKKAKHDV